MKNLNKGKSVVAIVAQINKIIRMEMNIVQKKSKLINESNENEAKLNINSDGHFLILKIV